MRDITIISYNSSGYLEIKHNDNATDKRILEILRKAAKKIEKKIHEGSH